MGCEWSPPPSAGVKATPGADGLVAKEQLALLRTSLDQAALVALDGRTSRRRWTSIRSESVLELSLN